MVPVRLQPFSAAQRPRLPSRLAGRVCAKSSADEASRVPVELAALITLAPFVAAPAYADVDDTVNVAVDSVKAVGEAVKSGVGLAQSAADVLSQAYTAVSPQIDEYVDKARPYATKAVDEVAKVAIPAAKDATSKAVPIVTEGTKSLLKSSGVDVDAVATNVNMASKTVKDAADVASPTVNKVVSFLTTSSPETLVKGAVFLVVIYYLTPFAIRSFISSIRGYAGEITPARAVDVVGTDGNVAIIDIRSLKEKSAVGTPDVPSSARGRFIELELAEVDRRLRGQLRNVDSVTAQVTALEIQALKRVNKGTKVLLLDKSGSGQAKAVAKELAKLGFGQAFVIEGGFAGWMASKLQTKQPVPGAKTGGPIGNILGTISTRPPPATEAKRK